MNQYRIIEHHDQAAAQACLNALAEDGWSLVSTVARAPAVWFVLERPAESGVKSQPSANDKLATQPAKRVKSEVTTRSGLASQDQS